MKDEGNCCDIVFINHGARVEIELNDVKVYEGTNDTCAILEALGFNVEEIYVPLEMHTVDDDSELDIEEI